MPGLKMNLNCPRRLAVYAVFDVLDTMGAEYARSMVGDIQAKVKVLGKTSGYAFAVTADIPHSRLPELCYIPLPEIEPLSFGAVYTAEGYTPLLRQFLRALSETVKQCSARHRGSMSPAFMPAVTASPAGSIPRTTPVSWAQAVRPATRATGWPSSTRWPMAASGSNAPSAGTRMMRWVV